MTPASTGAAAGRPAALWRRKHALDRAIAAEAARPAPCAFALQRLKRQRLALKDTLQRLRRLRSRLAAIG